MKRNFIMFVSIFLLSSWVCSAKSISVQIIQNNPGQEKIWATSYLVEQNVIDYFFSDGNIVSNSPVWISATEAENKKALKAALQENSDGGMEYLVRIELFYNANKNTNPEAPLLENIRKISWTNYSVKDGKQISSGDDEPGKITRDNNNETGVAKFANFVASKINSDLKKL